MKVKETICLGGKLIKERTYLHFQKQLFNVIKLANFVQIKTFSRMPNASFQYVTSLWKKMRTHARAHTQNCS